MSKSSDRKITLINAIEVLLAESGNLVTLAGDLNPLDANDALAVQRAFDATERTLSRAWEAFANVYFPEGENMDLHLRSENVLNPVALRGANDRKKSIYYENEASEKYGEIYIGSLLGGRSMHENGSRDRIGNLNVQLLHIEADQ